MTTAAVLTLAAAGALLLASTTSARANVEAGEGAYPTFDLSTLSDRAETIMHQITEQTAGTDLDTAGRNIAAFLYVIRRAEGTADSLDPWAVCYAYRHTIQNYADHPAVKNADRLGGVQEWTGERLPDAMCANAGFGPGCVSTAAGAYQIIRPTWLTIRNALGLRDFGPVSQDAAAVELIRRRGALEDVKAGRLHGAVYKCRNEWASLPGNFAKQGQRDINTLAMWFQNSGGSFA